MQKKQQIVTLFSDIGGVLLTNGWDHNARKKAAIKFKLDFEDLEERHRLVFDTYEIGKMTLDEYLNFIVFYGKKKRQCSRKDFKDFMFSQSKPNPQMIEMIRKLKSKYKLKIVAVSNEGKELMLNRIRKFKLTEFIDFFICSCFVHLRKPDEEIFRLALDLSQTDPKDVLYIEDRPLFVEIAKKFGIHSLHHSDFQSTQMKLSKMFPQIAK